MDQFECNRGAISGGKASEAMVSLYKRLGVLIFMLLIGGCVYGDISPKAVVEYRYFPEYKGYFPIEQPSPIKYNPPRVRADWVLPVVTPDGKPDYTSPSTKEEAEQRVKMMAERKKIFHPVLAFPLSLALSPLLMTVGEYYAHEYPRKLQQQQLKQLEEFAGIKIKMSIRDINGKPISTARVLEVVSPVEVPVYADQEGFRSFAPPVLHSYSLKSQMVDLMALSLPISLGTVEEFSGLIGSKDLIFNQRADQSGKVLYTSLAGGRFAQYENKMRKWIWTRPPTSLKMHFIVWAPGFKPSVYIASSVNLREEVNLTANLEQLPEGGRIDKIYNDYEKILKLIPKAIKRGSFVAWKIDKPMIISIVHTLEEWIQDDTLPSYIRWNAHHLLKGISNFLSSDKDIEQEVKNILMQIKEKTESLTPYLVDSDHNPWRLNERYKELFYLRVTRLEAGKVYSYYGYKALSPTSRMAEEAKDLISKLEAINPDFPELDNLRAVIALAEGERSHALSFSRYLSHSHFFSLFYGINVIEPRY